MAKHKETQALLTENCLLQLFSVIIYLLTTEADNFLSKALVFHFFLVFPRISEYTSLDLF